MKLEKNSVKLEKIIVWIHGAFTSINLQNDARIHQFVSHCQVYFHHSEPTEIGVQSFNPGPRKVTKLTEIGVQSSDLGNEVT